jgi:hypothetical protein
MSDEMRALAKALASLDAYMGNGGLTRGGSHEWAVIEAAQAVVSAAARPASGHPDQPFVVASDGVLRFKRNRLVEMLVDAYPGPGGGSLNALSIDGRDAPAEDWEQLNQLIGYSFSGYCDLSAVREETKARLGSVADAAWKARGASR